MSPEGIWSLRTATSEVDLAVGCVVLDSGRVLGGDAAFTYVGSFEVNPDNLMTATVKIRKYRNIRDTVYKDDYTLNLKGIYDDRAFTLAGYPEGNESIQFYVYCTRQEALP